MDETIIRAREKENLRQKSSIKVIGADLGKSHNMRIVDCSYLLQILVFILHKNDKIRTSEIDENIKKLLDLMFTLQVLTNKHMIQQSPEVIRTKAQNKIENHDNN